MAAAPDHPCDTAARTGDAVNHVRRTVSIERAAKLMGVSRRTVYYRMADGTLDYKTAGGSRRIFLDSLRPRQRQRRNDMTDEQAHASEDTNADELSSGETAKLPLARDSRGTPQPPDASSQGDGDSDSDDVKDGLGDEAE